MIDPLSELRAKWKEALALGAAGRQWRAVALSIPCCVRLLAGVRDRDGRISLLVETPVANAPKHRVRFQAEGISLIDERLIDDGLLRLAVTLERADLLDVFEDSRGRSGVGCAKSRFARTWRCAKSSGASRPGRPVCVRDSGALREKMGSKIRRKG